MTDTEILETKSEPVVESENTDISAIDEGAIKMQALEETLAEQRAMNAQILEELKELKLSNAKMALKLTAEKPVTDEDLFSGFSRYK